MARVLYIEASPRGERSFSSRVAQRFLRAYSARHPDDEIETLNLFATDLPEFGVEAAAQKMAQIDDLVAFLKSIDESTQTFPVQANEDICVNY